MSRKNVPENDVIEVGGVSFTHQDIFNVVDDFYTRIQADPLLQVPFRSVHDWPEHIERLTHFWWIRFGGKPYMFSEYNPVLKHFFAGFNPTFLKQWLFLFHETFKDHLTEDQAAFWTMLSQRMGQALSFKNDVFKQHYEAEHSEQSEE